VEGPDLELGRLVGGRYEVVRLLSDLSGRPRWLARDRVTGKRRELRPAPDDLTTQDAIDAREALGPYVIRVHAVESIVLDSELPEQLTSVLILEHHSHAITMATLAGTWRGVLLQVACHVAEGLDALHCAGRHVGVLTPTNVQVVSAAGGFVPVLDDLAPWEVSADDFSGPWVTGDAAFAAPELLNADGQGSAAADIFSLGVVTAHAWSGCMPFREEGGSALFGRGPSVLARRPRELAPGALDVGRLEPGLADIMVGCLALDATARPSAAELVEQLHALQASVAAPVVAPPAVSAASEPEEDPRRPAAPIAAFALDLDAITRSTEVSAEVKSAPTYVSPLTHAGSEATPPRGRWALWGSVALLGLGAWGWSAFAGEVSPVPMTSVVAASAPSPSSSPDVVDQVAQAAPAVTSKGEPREEDASDGRARMMLAQRTLHAALPALGCVGDAHVYAAGPPVVIELPCHVRCVVTVNDEGRPERLVRCHGDDVTMTGEGPALSCTGGRAGSEVRCTAEVVFLLGKEEKRVSDTLTLRVGL
jgi:hypothetical protein